jgi:hypothetical protein
MKEFKAFFKIDEELNCPLYDVGERLGISEKKGVYRFTSGLSPKEMKAAEIGDFVMLLMEGVKRVDEEQQAR